MIEHARKQKWVPYPLLNDVQALCDARKPWGHWRESFESESIQRRTLEASMGHVLEDDFNATRRRLLARAAHVSATTAMRLYFGNCRGGPHLGTQAEWAGANRRQPWHSASRGVESARTVVAL